nr:protein suppressor of K(+) transport growth defect 1 [Ipomoea batatas]
MFECFAQMHKKKDGMFVDERSKRIAEQVQARHDIATQEAEDSTESPNINMSQLYVDVVGGAKKQRIYGLGTKGSSFINGNSCGSSATSQLHQDAMKDMMNQQLETMRVDLEAKLQAEMDAKLQAERNQMQAQMQTQKQPQITSLMDELRRNGILSTSMPLPPQQAENSVNSNDENLGDD